MDRATAAYQARNTAASVLRAFLAEMEQVAADYDTAIADEPAVVAEFGYQVLRDWKAERASAREACATAREALRLLLVWRRPGPREGEVIDAYREITALDWTWTHFGEDGAILGGGESFAHARAAMRAADAAKEPR